MSPRFRLWHSVNTRSLRVLWAIEEMGLRRGHDYELTVLKFPPRQHQPDFLSTNTLGTVPWFEHQEAGDAAPRAAMSESCAVPVYLASLLNSPLAVLPAEPDHGAYLNWLFHADATLTFPQAVVMRYAVMERGRADVVAEDYGRWFIARLRLLNAALDDGREFACGGRFTLADICLTYPLFLASEDGLCGGGLVQHGGAALSSFFKPATREYLERMIARPAWAAAQREQARAAGESARERWRSGDEVP